jgi:hypothetical protein
MVFPVDRPQKFISGVANRGFRLVLDTSCSARTHKEAFEQTLLREGLTYDQIQAATIIPFPPKARSPRGSARKRRALKMANNKGKDVLGTLRRIRKRVVFHQSPKTLAVLRATRANFEQ